MFAGTDATAQCTNSRASASLNTPILWRRESAAGHARRPASPSAPSPIPERASACPNRLFHIMPTQIQAIQLRLRPIPTDSRLRYAFQGSANAILSVSVIEPRPKSYRCTMKVVIFCAAGHAATDIRRPFRRRWSTSLSPILATYALHAHFGHKDFILCSATAAT